MLSVARNARPALPETTNITSAILASLLISCRNLVAALAEPTWPITNLTPTDARQFRKYYSYRPSNAVKMGYGSLLSRGSPAASSLSPHSAMASTKVDFGSGSGIPSVMTETRSGLLRSFGNLL